ncbi:hypothetical protein [Paraclostridium sp. AKS81]|uniref:hypothetical protein n=1 Tax=Paraclostridium sp. AKS81 TaxID=2876117 RepID=UPI0021DFB65D|nr:hypothetical protein [Paraclostridium sp. AKS81]MCU9811209.1 hypothetical protein [Paraclostridium sp. AKS81]
MCGLKFYEGRKIETKTICKNNQCGENIVWYKIFRQPMSGGSYTCNSVAVDGNVSSANIEIINEYEDKLDVDVSYRCRLCDEYHNTKGTILKKDNILVFEEN